MHIYVTAVEKMGAEDEHAGLLNLVTQAKRGHPIFILIILASFGYINWSDITCAGQRFTEGQWSVYVQVKYMVLIDYL